MLVKKIVSGKLGNNTYIVFNDKKECFLVDASANIKDILKLVKDYKVLGVFLTHGHYDHFVNLEEILKTFNIKCFLTENELEKLYNPNQNYSHVFGLTKVVDLQKNNFIIVNNNQTLNLGDFKINVYVTKGHTNGGITLQVEDVLFTGDTLFENCCGRMDLLTGSPEDMKNSLCFIRKNFEGKTFYPGHGAEGIVKKQN